MKKRQVINEISWKKFQTYNHAIVSKFNIIHANSELAGKIYQKAFSRSAIKTVSITHEGLRQEKHKKLDCAIHFAYMGGMNKAKGFGVLVEACKILEQDKKLPPWDIFLYGGEYGSEYDKGKYHAFGYFGPDNAKKVWDQTDILIVPSNWNETFGFVVVEALEQEIPVICSDLVGSSYLEKDVKPSLLFHHGNADELAFVMRTFLAPETELEGAHQSESGLVAEETTFSSIIKNYRMIQGQIRKINLPDSMERHYEEMMQLYEEAERLEKNK